MQIKQVLIQNNDHDIPAILTVPDKVVGAVILLHGTGSNKNEAGNGYEVAAKMFSDLGLASIRFDFMGYGESEEDSIRYDFDSAVEDTLAVKNYLSERLPNVKIGVLGWSQGGTIALLCAGRFPEKFDAVVCWAGALDLKSLISEKQAAQAQKEGYFEMHYDWRSSTKASVKWVKDVSSVDVLAEFSAYQGPICAIAGENDTVVDPSCADKMVAVSVHPASKVCKLANVGHTFEVFDELQQQSLKQVIQLSADFMLQIFK